MADNDDFADLIRRVRRGDEAAANDLFQRYHKVLYRTVAIRLENSPLRATFDVEDACHTVFKSVFVRLRLGEYELARVSGDGRSIIATLTDTKQALATMRHSR